MTNVDVKQEIARIEAEIRAEMRYDRETAVKLLRENLTHLTERVNKGDIGAIQARTAVIRELNAISNLHSSTVHTTEDKPLELTPEEARLYRDSAAIANRARIKSA